MNNSNNYEGFDGLIHKMPTKEKPPLNFELEGKQVTIYGGSCHEPAIDDADVYISLDVEQPVYFWEQPWYENEGKKHIRLPIEDMFIPNDTEDFNSCVEFAKYYLSEGKKIHVGCIGGAGRTGMFLSALVQASMGDKLIDEDGNKISAIDYVRENYYKHAVETIPQILFLHYNCGIDFPKNSEKDLNKFFDLFEEEVGVSLKEILSKGRMFDDVTEVIREVDDLMYANNFKNQKLNNNIPSGMKPFK